jgi:hypothetical protein
MCRTQHENYKRFRSQIESTSLKVYRAKITSERECGVKMKYSYVFYEQFKFYIRFTDFEIIYGN